MTLPQQFLDRIRRRLGVVDPMQILILDDFIADAIQDIMNFCNREDLPPELYHEAARIAGDAWLLGQVAAGTPDAQESTVDSVGMAGVTIKYGLTQDQRDVMENKLAQMIEKSQMLKQFRLLRRVKLTP